MCLATTLWLHLAVFLASTLFNVWMWPPPPLQSLTRGSNVWQRLASAAAACDRCLHCDLGGGSAAQAALLRAVVAYYLFASAWLLARQ